MSRREGEASLTKGMPGFARRSRMFVHLSAWLGFHVCALPQGVLERFVQVDGQPDSSKAPHRPQALCICGAKGLRWEGRLEKCGWKQRICGRSQKIFAPGINLSKPFLFCAYESIGRLRDFFSLKLGESMLCFITLLYPNF